MDIHLTQNRTNPLDELLKLKPQDHILKKDSTEIPLFLDLISTEMEMPNNDVTNLSEDQGFQDFASSNEEIAFDNNHNERTNEVGHAASSYNDFTPAVNNKNSVNAKQENMQKDDDVEVVKDSTFKGSVANPVNRESSSEVSKIEDLRAEKEGNSEKGRLFTKLQKLITGLLQARDSKKNPATNNLDKLLSSDKKTSIKLKAENIKNMLETVKNDGTIDKELIGKLSVLLSEIEKNLKSNATRRLDLTKISEVGKRNNQNVISELDKILSLMDNNSKGGVSKIISKLSKLISKEAEKLVETEVPLSKSFGPKLSENEKIKQGNSDLIEIKHSLKNRESIDNKIKTEKDLYSENETNTDSRLTKDKNVVDKSSVNLDKDIKLDQRFTLSQNDKNSLDGQQQNKNKFMQQSHNFKSNNKQQGVDMNSNAVSDKTQSASNFESKMSQGKLPTTTRTITHSQMGDSVVRGAKQFLKGGNSEIHLTIKKPDLGNIRISFVENSKGKLEVVIMAERSEASELIKQNSAEMRQLLLQEGLDLSKFNVSDYHNKNKGFFSEGKGYRKNSRKGRNSSDDESLKQDETILESDILKTSRKDETLSNDQVNVFV